MRLSYDRCAAIEWKAYALYYYNWLSVFRAPLTPDTLGSKLIRYWSDTEVLDQYLIDIDQGSLLSENSHKSVTYSHPLEPKF